MRGKGRRPALVLGHGALSASPLGPPFSGAGVGQWECSGASGSDGAGEVSRLRRGAAAEVCHVPSVAEADAAASLHTLTVR